VHFIIIKTICPPFSLCKERESDCVKGKEPARESPVRVTYRTYYQQKLSDLKRSLLDVHYYRDHDDDVDRC